MATTDTAAPRTELAAHAWAHLGAVFMVQRDVWLAAAQAEELSPPQALALMRLRPEGTYSLGDLARCLRCDASQMTANADRLEERGFAERRTSAEDRRVKVLMPTPAGVEAQARLRAAFRTPPPAFADLPAEDLAALARVAHGLVPSIDPDTAAIFGLPEGPAGTCDTAAPAG
ncbi:MAG: MarR family transcriptional regulator [Miltoncostaeaceae bacterium]